MEANKQRQVNWQDGMKINKNHFINSDNFHIGQQILTRSLLLNEYNFGILPNYDKSKDSFELKLLLDGEFIHITKFRISALMLNGMSISIDSEDISSNNIDDNLKLKFRFTEFTERNFVFLLKTNSFKGIEFGKFDSEDFPLKRPYLLPSFDFILSPISKVKESFFSDDFFIISKFEIDNNEIVIDKKYIPPVTCLVSNVRLTEFHSFIYNSINILEGYLVDIAKRNAKNKSDNYSETLVILSNNLINYISSIKYNIKHLYLFEAPITLLISLKSLANIISKTIEIRTSLGKDMFFNEVISIIGKSKQEFDELLKQVINLDYRHFDISSSIEISENLISTLLKIFKTISEGEHKNKKNVDLIIKK